MSEAFNDVTLFAFFSTSSRDDVARSSERVRELLCTFVWYEPLKIISGF